MKSAHLHYPRIGFAAALIALLAGCYGTSYVGVRHDSYGYRHYGYTSTPYYGYRTSYPYYGTRYSYRPYYRPYGYRYYSGYGGPSLSVSYSRTTYRAPSYSTPATYSYRTSGTAPRYSGTTYVASSPTYTSTRVATGSGKHVKRQAHTRHDDKRRN